MNPIMPIFAKYNECFCVICTLQLEVSNRMKCIWQYNLGIGIISIENEDNVKNVDKGHYTKRMVVTLQSYEN